MKKVVIVGGGFGGIETALRLKQYRDPVEILLINEDDCFAFIPSLYETAAGEMDEGDICILISSLLEHKGITYYHDSVEKIDVRKKTLRTKRMRSIPWDVLVIACGAVTNYYDVPGAQKHAFNLKTKEDAQAIFETINQVLSSGKRQDFVICGGGLTGVEFAGALVDHIKRSCRTLKCDPLRYSLTLVDRNPAILHGLPDKARSFAMEYLTKKGVVLRTGKEVTKIAKTAVCLGEEKIRSDMTIWCGGLRTHPLIAASGLPYSGKDGERAKPGGGMLVNDYLQLAGRKDVFGVGDCITKRSDAILKTAQNAIHESRTVAYNIHALLAGKPLKKYSAKKNVVYCSLGKDMGMLIDGSSVKTGKAVKAKKDRLESAYVKTLRSEKIPKNNIYS